MQHGRSSHFMSEMHDSSSQLLREYRSASRHTDQRQTRCRQDGGAPRQLPNSPIDRRDYCSMPPGCRRPRQLPNSPIDRRDYCSMPPGWRRPQTAPEQSNRQTRQTRCRQDGGAPRQLSNSPPLPIRDTISMSGTRCNYEFSREASLEDRKRKKNDTICSAPKRALRHKVSFNFRSGDCAFSFLKKTLMPILLLQARIPFA